MGFLRKRKNLSQNLNQTQDVVIIEHVNFLRQLTAD